MTTQDPVSRILTSNACRFSQSALRKMYKILLGQVEPPDDVIPDFMKEELSGVGNAAQQTMERGRFLKVNCHTATVTHRTQLARLSQEMGSVLCSCCVINHYMLSIIILCCVVILSCYLLQSTGTLTYGTELSSHEGNQLHTWHASAAFGGLCSAIISAKCTSKTGRSSGS